MRFLSLAEAVVEGVVSVPLDIYYGGRRTLEDVGVFGAEVQHKNSQERDRIVSLIQKCIENRGLIEQLVSMIINDFSNRLPSSVAEKLQDNAAASGVKVISRFSTQQIFSIFLGTQLVKKIALKGVIALVTRVGVGVALTAVLLQGLIERASNASYRLHDTNPRLHRKLKDADLDMIYFLVEDMVAPFVCFSGESDFDQIVKKIEELAK